MCANDYRVSTMSSNSSSVSGSRPGPIQVPVSSPRPAAPAGGRRPGRAAGGGGQRDPLDLDQAFERLASLLGRDGEDGPRPGVPRRGYYLNILA